MEGPIPVACYRDHAVDHAIAETTLEGLTLTLCGERTGRKVPQAVMRPRPTGCKVPHALSGSAWPGRKAWGSKRRGGEG